MLLLHLQQVSATNHRCASLGIKKKSLDKSLKNLLLSLLHTAISHNTAMSLKDSKSYYENLQLYGVKMWFTFVSSLEL